MLTQVSKTFAGGKLTTIPSSAERCKVNVSFSGVKV